MRSIEGVSIMGVEATHLRDLGALLGNLTDKSSQRISENNEFKHGVNIDGSPDKAKGDFINTATLDGHAFEVDTFA
jgi:hypothetical protein